MTIYISDAYGVTSRWCILRDPGGQGASHITLCGARMDAAEPYLIAGAAPEAAVCSACGVKRDEFAAVWAEDEANDFA